MFLFAFLCLFGCKPDDQQGAIGDACRQNNECSHGLCLLPFPEGYCSMDCSTGQCPAGSECVDLSGLPRCMKTCAESSECRTDQGYACNHGVCDLACTNDDECLDFEKCGDGGVCIERNDIPAGEACGRDEHCDSGFCLAQADGSYCSMDCSSQSECDPFGMFCSIVQDPSGEGVLIQVCRNRVGSRDQDEPCGSHSECGSGLCVLEGCSLLCDDVCDDVHSCQSVTIEVDGLETQVNACIEIIENEIEIQEFSDVEIPAPMGSPFEVTVRRGTMSFMVYVEGDENHYYALSDLVAPDGTVLIDDELSGINMIMPAKGIFTAMVPDTDFPEGAIQNGVYRFNVIAFDDAGLVIPSTAAVKILLKRRREESLSSGSIDLHIFIAEGAKEGVSAATAASDPEVQTSIERFGNFYTAVGNIDIHAVLYYDISSSFAVIDDDNELGEMLRLSSNATGGGLALFFVASLAGIDGGPAGYSGGIPGPPDISGTGRSGVAIVFHGDERITADTLCHEAGHYLGLFHTSELYSEAVETRHDPISDTAECVLRTPEDLSSCEARFNIMFPQINSLQDTLSSGQGFVCKNNVIIK